MAIVVPHELPASHAARSSSIRASVGSRGALKEAGATRLPPLPVLPTDLQSVAIEGCASRGTPTWSRRSPRRSCAHHACGALAAIPWSQFLQVEQPRDGHPKTCRQAEGEQGGRAVIPGLDRADRLSGDVDERGEVRLRQPTLSACRIQSVCQSGYGHVSAVGLI